MIVHCKHYLNQVNHECGVESTARSAPFTTLPDGKLWLLDTHYNCSEMKSMKLKCYYLFNAVNVNYWEKLYLRITLTSVSLVVTGELILSKYIAESITAWLPLPRVCAHKTEAILGTPFTSSLWVRAATWLQHNSDCRLLSTVYKTIGRAVCTNMAYIWQILTVITIIVLCD